MSTEKVTLEELMAYVERLLDANNLSRERFEELGEKDELLALSPALDFAYKAVWPLLRERVPAA